MKDLSKEKRISEEKAKLNLLLKDLEEDVFNSLQSLVDNTAFMAITLEDLQQAINENGVVEEYQNGPNQHGFKESTEVKVYNTMIRNYRSSIKELAAQLHQAGAAIENDGFDEFISRRDRY